MNKKGSWIGKFILVKKPILEKYKEIFKAIVRQQVVTTLLHSKSPEASGVCFLAV